MPGDTCLRALGGAGREGKQGGRGLPQGCFPEGCGSGHRALCRRTHGGAGTQRVSHGCSESTPIFPKESSSFPVEEHWSQGGRQRCRCDSGGWTDGPEGLWACAWEGGSPPQFPRLGNGAVGPSRTGRGCGESRVTLVEQCWGRVRHSPHHAAPHGGRVRDPRARVWELRPLGNGLRRRGAERKNQ